MTMNTLLLALLLTFAFGFTPSATTRIQPSRKNRPTQLAHYQMGAYLAAQGTKLRVHIDKQLGGQVYVTLTDLKGNLYFDRTIGAVDTTARLSLDLTDLADGGYVLKVTNGLEMETREIKITTMKPTIAPRSITVL